MELMSKTPNIELINTDIGRFYNYHEHLEEAEGIVYANYSNLGVQNSG